MTAKDAPMWLVLFPVQQEQIKAWCWGACGHGQVGAVDLAPEPVSAVPCFKADCPHLEREMDEPCGEVQGHPAFLRKLLPVGEVKP